MRSSNDEKTCGRCEKTKSVSAFYRDSTRKDGLQNWCKDCNRAHIKQYRSIQENKEKLNEYMRGWYKTTNGKNASKRNGIRLRSIHPDRYRARWIMNEAIRYGRIVRGPCVVCGKYPAHGHHHDYSKPLDVVWLCVKHHSEIHNKSRKAVSL